MRRMRYLPKAPCMTALAFLIGMASLSSCSSDNKTVVALTINSDDTVGMVDQIVVTASSASHGDVTTSFAPNKNPDSGVIVASFFERIELEGFSGETNLKVDANGAGGSIASATAKVDVKSNAATAARVSLTTKKPTVDAGPPADAGAGDADDSDAQN